MDEFDKLFKTHEQIKDDIIKDFAIDLVNEINKIIVKCCLEIKKVAGMEA